MDNKPNFETLGVNVKDEIYKEELASSEPKCMKDRCSVEVDPTAPNLTKEEYTEAKNVLYKKAMLKFPKVLKQRVDPPLNGQVYCLHTFVPAEGASPDSDGCFGILKFRGAFPNVNEADEHAERIIRTVDSYNVNFIGFVGKEFPLTLRSDFCEETREVDLKNKLDSVSKSNFKKQKDKEEKDIEDIKEREKKLLEESKEETPDDAEEYTKYRVKLASARYFIDTLVTKRQQAEKVVAETSKQIQDLDLKNPDCRKQYKAKYLDALAKSGVQVDSNPLVKYMDAYDNDNLITEIHSDFKQLQLEMRGEEKKEEVKVVEQSETKRE